MGASANGGCGHAGYEGTCADGLWGGCRSYTDKTRIGLLLPSFLMSSKGFPRIKPFPYDNSNMADASFETSEFVVRGPTRAPPPPPPPSFATPPPTGDGSNNAKRTKGVHTSGNSSQCSGRAMRGSGMDGRNAKAKKMAMCK